MIGFSSLILTGLFLETSSTPLGTRKSPRRLPSSLVLMFSPGGGILGVPVNSGLGSSTLRGMRSEFLAWGASVFFGGRMSALALDWSSAATALACWASWSWAKAGSGCSSSAAEPRARESAPAAAHAITVTFFERMSVSAPVGNGVCSCSQFDCRESMSRRGIVSQYVPRIKAMVGGLAGTVGVVVTSGIDGAWEGRKLLIFLHLRGAVLNSGVAVQLGCAPAPSHPFPGGKNHVPQSLRGSGDARPAFVGAVQRPAHRHRVEQRRQRRAVDQRLEPGGAGERGQSQLHPLAGEADPGTGAGGQRRGRAGGEHGRARYPRRRRGR